MTRIRARLTLAVILSGLLGACGGPPMVRLLDPTALLRPRPSHYGLSLPVPVSSMLWAADSIPLGKAERLLPIDLRVDRKGAVVSVTEDSSVGKAFLSCLVPYLKSLRFEPGLRDGTPAEMTLRLVIQTDGACGRPVLLFPVGPNRQISRNELYWAAMAANGIEPANLVSFPQYYYVADPLKSGAHYDYKLYRVDLDSLGKVTAVDPMAATVPEFTDQIRTAVMWGEYEPMKIDGRPIASTNYLAIALFAEMEYPTVVWTARSNSERSAEERLRVRLLPDTVGEMMPPVVRRDWSGGIVDSATWETVPNLVSARLRIDTAGATVVDQISTPSWRVRTVLGSRAHDRRFFPARDFFGRSLPWQGLAYVRYQGPSHFKVWFDWAPDPDPGPGPDSTVAH